MGGYLAIWQEGDLTPEQVPDPGLTLGLGVFETLSVFSGRVFAQDRHLRRLRDGAARLGLPAPDPARVEGGVAAVSREGIATPHARLRLTWTGGPDGRGRLLVTLAPYTGPARVAVELSAHLRNETSPISSIKCTSFAENMLALRAATDLGADEAILANTRGELAEGATSNVFVETDGELLTPPLDSGCLPGITRELCLEWGREAGLPIRETPLPFDVMNTTAAAAVTSALKGVVPIHRVGARRLETGTLTARLAEIYLRRRRDSLTL